jgi:hypothetical protein
MVADALEASAESEAPAQPKRDRRRKPRRMVRPPGESDEVARQAARRILRQHGYAGASGDE